MSTVGESTNTAEHEATTHEDHGHSPSTREYVATGVVIGLLLAVEVGLFYAAQAGLQSNVAMWGILAAAVLKFVVAAAFFMHLRADHPFYRQIFLPGVVIALLVFGVTIAILLGPQAPR